MVQDIPDLRALCDKGDQSHLLIAHSAQQREGRSNGVTSCNETDSPLSNAGKTTFLHAAECVQLTPRLNIWHHFTGRIRAFLHIVIAVQV